MVVIKVARVTQISMGRTYHLTTGPRATYHNIILTLNHLQSYSSGHHVSLSWSLHLLNWESIKCCLISLICSTQFIFMQEMKTAAWSYHPAPSISAVYKYWINTAALTCLEQHFPKIYGFFSVASPSSPGEKKAAAFLTQNCNIPKQCDNMLFFNKPDYHSMKIMSEETKSKLLCEGFWVLFF